MLNSLSIRNYRVSECIIEGLGRINVFIGRNNSGKSSALEAISIVKSMLKNDAFGEPLLKTLLSRRGIERSAYTARDFWHDYRTTEPISLSLGFDEMEETIDVKVTWLRDDKLTIEASKVGPERPTPGGGLFRDIYGKFLRTPDVSTSSSGGGEGNMESVFDSALSSYLQNLTLVDDQIARKLERHETILFGKVLESRLDKKVAQELSESYEVPAESLSYIPFSPNLHGKTKLAIVTPELAVHIDDMGDGAKYAIVILSIALLLKNTALLIEEIESHQHSGAIKKILPSLVEVVTENNVQLFITTHSLEVIRTLSCLAEKYDVRFFHFEKSHDDVINVRGISRTDGKLLSDLGVDLRYLHKRFLIVEGKNDAAFLDAIVKRTLKNDIDELGYFMVVAGNKGLAKQLAAALASTGREIVIALDYDGETSKSLAESIQGALSGRGLKLNIPSDGSAFTIPSTGSKVRLIVLGILEDSFLEKIGITRHEMEDYLLKAIAVDKKVARWFGLNPSQLAEEARKAGFEHLNKSETLLRCGAMKKGMEYEGLIKKIIELTGPKRLRKIAANVLASLTS